MVRSTSHGTIGITEAFITARNRGWFVPISRAFPALPDRIELSTL